MAGLLLACCLALSGCSKHPVTKDLESYAAMTKLVINPAEAKPLEGRLRAARSPFEQAAVMNTYAETLDRQVAVLRTYQPKIPEVGKLTTELHSGMSKMAQAAHDFQGLSEMINQARVNQDRDLAMRVLGRTRLLMDKMNEGRNVMTAAVNELEALAAKKGVKMPK